MLSRHSLRDQVALVNNAARLRRPCFAVINALQTQQVSSGEMVVASAVALIAMVQSTNLNLQDVLTKAQNILADVEGPFSAHLQAVRAYAAGELLNRGQRR